MITDDDTLPGHSRVDITVAIALWRGKGMATVIMRSTERASGGGVMGNGQG
jgi:hypothetical protein